MLATGDADALVTGATRSYSVALEGIRTAIDPAPGSVLFGLTLMLARVSGTVFIADTAIHERPGAAALADIATQSAAAARRLGHEPRVAFLSFSTFGDPKGSIPGSIREAVKLLDERGADFEYDGEMAADVALDPGLRAQPLPVLPPDRPGERAGDARAARRAHPDQGGAAPDQRHHHRPAADGHEPAGADRARWMRA